MPMRQGKGQDWFVVVNGKEGPAFDRVVLPVFSPDGKLLVYRARKEGKRFLVVADTAGKTIKQLPAYEQVFQPVFTGDGKSVAYGVKDGNKLDLEGGEAGQIAVSLQQSAVSPEQQQSAPPMLNLILREKVVCPRWSLIGNTGLSGRRRALQRRCESLTGN